jgi:glycosyltransferase involved in cell wall biosynthesis
LTRGIPRKNILNVIAALDIMHSSCNVDFEYVLAGGGMDRRRVLRRLRKVRFPWRYLGEIPEREKLEQYYPSLDVFVLPTLDLRRDIEGFGMVYLEANAAGVPVVASNVGGVRDAVKENVSGVFADPRNPEHIARAIMQVLREKDRYVRGARQWAGNFSIERAARRIAGLYECVLAT